MVKLHHADAGCMIGVLVMLALIADAHMLKTVLTWVVPYFCVVIMIYAKLNDWPLEQSFFYAVDTGCSIGFGAFEETNDTSRAFTVVHILLTDSLIVFGAFQLFLDKTLNKSTISNEALQRFYRQLTRQSGRSNETKTDKKEQFTPSTDSFAPVVLLCWRFMGNVQTSLVLSELAVLCSECTIIGRTRDTTQRRRRVFFVRMYVRRIPPLSSIQHKQKHQTGCNRLSDSTV